MILNSDEMQKLLSSLVIGTLPDLSEIISNYAMEIRYLNDKYEVNGIDLYKLGEFVSDSQEDQTQEEYDSYKYSSRESIGIGETIYVAQKIGSDVRLLIFNARTNQHTVRTINLEVSGRKVGAVEFQYTIDSLWIVENDVTMYRYHLESGKMSEYQHLEKLHTISYYNVVATIQHVDDLDKGETLRKVKFYHPEDNYTVPTIVEFEKSEKVIQYVTMDKYATVVFGDDEEEREDHDEYIVNVKSGERVLVDKKRLNIKRTYGSTDDHLHISINDSFYHLNIPKLFLGEYVINPGYSPNIIYRISNNRYYELSYNHGIISVDNNRVEIYDKDIRGNVNAMVMFPTI